MWFRTHILIFPMLINTFSVGNISREKQLQSIPSIWPWLASTHNQYEEKRLSSQICKIKTSNKSTIWTSIFVVCFKTGTVSSTATIYASKRKERGLTPMSLTANALIPHWASVELAHRQLRGRNTLACVKIKWRLRFLYAAASEVGLWITFWSQVGLWKKINLP